MDSWAVPSVEGSAHKGDDWHRRRLPNGSSRYLTRCHQHKQSAELLPKIVARGILRPTLRTPWRPEEMGNLAVFGWVQACREEILCELEWDFQVHFICQPQRSPPNSPQFWADAKVGMRDGVVKRHQIATVLSRAQLDCKLRAIALSSLRMDCWVGAIEAFLRFSSRKTIKTTLLGKWLSRVAHVPGDANCNNRAT